MNEKAAVAALAALAQEARLRVFRALVGAGPEGMTPSALAAMLDIPSSTLSFHLKELSRAGLIASRQDGRFIWYRADLEAISGLIGYLTENCCRASSVCDTACVPAGAPRPVASPLPARRKRESA